MIDEVPKTRLCQLTCAVFCLLDFLAPETGTGRFSRNGAELPLRCGIPH